MTFLSRLDKDWGRTAWCVPSAFSMLTGSTLTSSHEKFAFLEHQKLEDLSGVAMSNLLMALGDAGKVCHPVALCARYPQHTYGPTLERYMRERPMGEERMYPLLILVPGHVLCGQMDWLGDNWTGQAVPVSAFPKLKRNVHKVWIVK